MGLDGRSISEYKHSTEIYSCRMSPDGGRLIVDDHNRIAKLFDGNFKELATLPSGFHFADFSPDGTRFLTIDGSYVRLFSIADGSLLAEFHVSSEAANAYFSHDGQRIVTATTDYDFGVWERRRPERFYGVLVLPAFWLSAFLAFVLVASFFSRQKAQKNAGN